MHQTHFDTHLSHLQHAFEHLKYLFWFGYPKVLAKNSENQVSSRIRKKRVQQPFASIITQIKWKKLCSYL